MIETYFLTVIVFISFAEFGSFLEWKLKKHFAATSDSL